MWAVDYNDAAAKTFRKLDGKVQRAIRSKLDELKQLKDPGALAKPLTHDLKGRWRLHIGTYRVIFSMDKSVLLILVIDIGRRDSIYD